MSTMHPILLKLADGDRRSIGPANEVAEEIALDSTLFDVVFGGMLDDNPVVSMRASDAVEKATRTRPELLRPYKNLLLHEVAASEHREVRWHAAGMLSRLPLDESELEFAVRVLEGYLEDDSRIVQVNAMQALADLAGRHVELRPHVVQLVEKMMDTGGAAVRARGRKLLAKLSP